MMRQEMYWPEGEMLYSRIASAAVQIQDAEEELSASATLEHGAICISATETALNIYLSEKLRAFHNNFPGIRLRISNHSTPQAVQAVKNGEVDFAVISTPAEVEQSLKTVELRPFYEVLVGGKTFTALASQNLSLKELTNDPLISRMVLECGAPVNILFADTRIFEGVLHGHMVIELPNDKREADKIITWLSSSSVNWKEEI